MTEILKTSYKALYNADNDFKQYVDKFAASKNITIDEALTLNIIKQYGEYTKELPQGRK